MQSVLMTSFMLSLLTLSPSLLTENVAIMNTQIDFISEQELNNWVIVNDTVMGGRSRAAIAAENNMLSFGGILSLQNNGGFASTRRIKGALNWNGKGRLEIKVLGDGRTYQFRLRTDRYADGVAYVANFKTKKDVMQTVQFELDQFTPQFRGRLVSNAPKLEYKDVSQLGFMLADKKPGEFILKVEHIKQLPELI